MQSGNQGTPGGNNGANVEITKHSVAVVSKDSASEISKGFHHFFVMLNKAISVYPDFHVYKASQGVTWGDFTKFPSRLLQKWSKPAGNTRPNGIVDQQRSRYYALKDLLIILQDTGQKLLKKLPDDSAEFDYKIRHLASLSQDHETIISIIDYFAASTAIGLVNDDVLPLLISMKNKERFAVRHQAGDTSAQTISPTQFIQLMTDLMAFAGNRSSKIVLKLEAVDGEAKRKFRLEESELLQHVILRFQSVAVLSDMFAAFRVFATYQPQQLKSAAQLAEEARAALDALEAEANVRAMTRVAERQAQGLPVELTADEDLMESDIPVGIGSKEVKTLRDFTNNFDLELLFPLLTAFRNWELGVKGSAKTLHSAIRSFISYKDSSVLMKTNTVNPNAKMTDEELDKLGTTIHAWMKAEIKDDSMEECITTLKKAALARVTVKPESDNGLSGVALEQLKHNLADLLKADDEQVEEAKLDELREEAAAQPVNLEGVTRAELDKLSTVLAGMSDLVDEVLDVELETEGQPAGLVEDQLEVATDVDTQAEAQQEDAFEGDFTDEHHQTLQAAFARVFIADNERPVDRELRLFNEERTRLGLRALPGRPARSGNK